ncbi:MAG TPA: hypothetical protein DCP91_03455, partial [Eggerthellaceae bacterium]|nr:hypothetical protein [Eggerthellaceae bacterium]
MRAARHRRRRRGRARRGQGRAHRAPAARLYARRAHGRLRRARARRVRLGCARGQGDVVAVIFSKGDIVEFDFSPSVGHEPTGRRPALVVSRDKFNLSTSMTLVCPITTRANPFPLHLELPAGLETYGVVAVEQVRA